MTTDHELTSPCNTTSCVMISRYLKKAVEETVLQHVINRLNDVGRCCGMEMNVGKQS
jgi:hypothetical protein